MLSMHWKIVCIRHREASFLPGGTAQFQSFKRCTRKSYVYDIEKLLSYLEALRNFRVSNDAFENRTYTTSRSFFLPGGTAQFQSFKRCTRKSYVYDIEKLLSYLETLSNFRVSNDALDYYSLNFAESIYALSEFQTMHWIIPWISRNRSTHFQSFKRCTRKSYVYDIEKLLSYLETLSNFRVSNDALDYSLNFAESIYALSEFQTMHSKIVCIRHREASFLPGDTEQFQSFKRCTRKSYVYDIEKLLSYLETLSNFRVSNDALENRMYMTSRSFFLTWRHWAISEFQTMHSKIVCIRHREASFLPGGTA